MIRVLLLTLTLIVFLQTNTSAQDYKQSPEYLALRDSMHHAFNDGDSARFYPALKALQNYLLMQGDTHAYYTQRCNEIIFEMNRRKVFEAYMLGRQLSMELREKNLDNEMYMAYNMLGHINRLCGNKIAAKRNFYTVIDLMEKGGYYESMPPIYMNIVNVEINDDHDEAMRLLDRAEEIARKYSPERVFDIETRRTISYYNSGETEKFLEGYKAYKEGVKEGKSSVHGRMMEVYYLASLGKYDEAVKLAKEELDDGDDIITTIYEKAGRWKEAYESLRQAYNANDSVNNVALANSMMGIRDQLRINDMENESTRNRMIGLTIGIILLGLLVIALVYIVQSRRRHLKQLGAAYKHALEADKMKTRFIQNVSHEVRTPLNIISGFSQVIADPDLTDSVEERQHMAGMMQKSAMQITNLIDEIIGLSLIETSTTAIRDDVVKVNELLESVMTNHEETVQPGVTLRIDSELAPEFTIATNRNMLSRIVSALIDNAIKYTDKGSIVIKASSFAHALTIAVEDTGCGIPIEEAENIFGRFVKLDSFKQGIGLGLPLSRKLAEQLGGTVTLDTSYHPGARFVVTLPIDRKSLETIDKKK
jgi:signal transduction histidine kinase